MDNVSEEKNLFRKFSSLMDQNIRGVQYGIYSVAGLGLIIALRSVRPFAKFCLPSDIPKHFLEKKIPFIAKVKLIESSGKVNTNPVMLVDHKPLVNLLAKNRCGALPLEISSVNVTNNGFLWLQTMLSNQDITFIPLRTDKDKVYSVVLHQKQNVGEQLVKIGFATVSPIDLDLKESKYYLKYYKSLLAAEKKAEKKGAGIWASTKVPFKAFLFNKIKSLLPFSQ